MLGRYLSVKVTIWSSADKQLTDKSGDLDRRTNRGTETILVWRAEGLVEADAFLSLSLFLSLSPITFLG